MDTPCLRRDTDLVPRSVAPPGLCQVRRWGATDLDEDQVRVFIPGPPLRLIVSVSPAYTAQAMSEKPPPAYKMVQRYDIPGHAHFLTFSCYRRLPLLASDDSCSVLADCVRKACSAHDCDVWAYVFMPEHVHLLVRPRSSNYRISDVLKAVKQPAATRLLNRLKKEASPVLAQLLVHDVSRRRRHRFWQAGGGHDLNIWSATKAVEKAEYCHRNPVTRGLVDDPGDWRWSSYRALEMGSTTDLPLELDAWEEVF